MKLNCQENSHWRFPKGSEQGAVPTDEMSVFSRGSLPPENIA